MQDCILFARPVIIAETPSGPIRIVRSARDAAVCVTGDWPFLRSHRTLQAVRALIETIKGRTPAEEARRAFAEAAEEAGLLVEMRGIDQNLH